MPTFCMFSHTPPLRKSISCQYATGHRIWELLFFMSGKRLHWTPCPLACAMLHCVLFCTILSLECTPKHTGLTLLGGKNKTQLWGNRAEWCNPSVSKSFFNSSSNESQRQSTFTYKAGCPLWKLQELRLYTIISKSNNKLIMAQSAPKCHKSFLLFLGQIISRYSSNSKWELGSLGGLWETRHHYEIFSLAAWHTDPSYRSRLTHRAVWTGAKHICLLLAWAYFPFIASLCLFLPFLFSVLAIITLSNFLQRLLVRYEKGNESSSSNVLPFNPLQVYSWMKFCSCTGPRCRKVARKATIEAIASWAMDNCWELLVLHSPIIALTK